MTMPMTDTLLPIPLQLTENCLRVLEKRYLAKNEEGKVVETPDQLFQRVAMNLAQADAKYGATPRQVLETATKFYALMGSLDFLPNSPTLMNAGRPLQQLAACFVLPIDDSIESIYDTLKYQAIIHQTGGGTGFSFSRLRPKNDIVKSTGGVASGPISFMKVYNHSTEHIKQGGTRRGANMGILRVDHPDILDFIACKQDTKEITNFNISVAITDTFMKAAKDDVMYDLINPRNGKPAGQLNAREVLMKIAQCAWQTGEPGLFFIDEANRKNPVPHVGMIEATNPCGEQPLLPFEPCTLGSINLERHVDLLANGSYAINWNKLKESVRTAVHFLDNVVDMNKYPIPEIEAVALKTRKIGLGVMGFAEMLYRLELPYDSEEGVRCGRDIMKFVLDTAYDMSEELADIRGPYPAWEGSRHQTMGRRLRNSYVTTVAPTGTISMIADTSGGCEPQFALAWFKNVMDKDHLQYYNQYFAEVAKREGFWTEDLMQQIIDNHGSARGVAQVPTKWQQVFAISHDIAPAWHVRMQAAFQDSTDSGVSKTINMPTSATVDDVLKAYLMAHDLQCKGITVYRDGSRGEQVMNVGVSTKASANGTPANGTPQSSIPCAVPEPVPVEQPATPAKDLPDLMIELRLKVKIEKTHSFMHLSIELPQTIRDRIIEDIRKYGREREIFFSPSPELKNRELMDLNSRLASHMLRGNFRLEDVLTQVTRSYDQYGNMMSPLYPMMKGMALLTSTIRNSPAVKIACPDCNHSPMIVESGCFRCGNCGWSKC